MNGRIARLLFALALGGVVVFALAASASALPCLRCFDVGGEQTAVANHAEPNCAWAQMHACTKARWQIEANCGPNWRETSVTQSPCTYSGGLNYASCTITYVCQECFEICPEQPPY